MPEPYRFPFGHLAYHRAAWAALCETLPWEALAVSLGVFCGAWSLLGSDLGIAIGLSVTLLLVALQMLRTRVFATSFRIVRQRGLFLRHRADIPSLPSSTAASTCTSSASDSFGDIVLVTAAVEKRLRAIRDPASVLQKLLAMRTPGSSGVRGE